MVCCASASCWRGRRRNTERWLAVRAEGARLPDTRCRRYSPYWCHFRRVHPGTPFTVNDRLAPHVHAARVRLDKWLWAARFFKTRSLALQAIQAGRVRWDGEAVKPAREVRIDDLLEIRIGDFNWEVRVRGLSEVRGPAGIAQTLYAETEASMMRRAAQVEQRRFYREPGESIKGRPSKRDRRDLDRVLGS